MTVDDGAAAVATTEEPGEAAGQTAATALAGGAEGSVGDGDAAGNGADAAGGWPADLPENLQKLVKAKGWKGAVDALGSYESLEKAFGAERAGRKLVALPKDGEPDEAWSEVWAQLGRPQKAEEYGLAQGEGVDPDFAAWAGQTFLEAGLTKRQAEAVRDKWQAYQAEMVQAEDRQFLSRAESEFAELKRDWGGEADAKIALGAQFAARAGFSEGELAAVERVIGTRTMLERFAEMGARLGEDVPPAGESAGVFGDAEAAKAEIEKLGRDKAFQAKVRGGDREARETWDRLHQVAYAEKAA